MIKEYVPEMEVNLRIKNCLQNLFRMVSFLLDMLTNYDKKNCPGYGGKTKNKLECTIPK